eukprot:298524-Prymnesium_polylepis.1
MTLTTVDRLSTLKVEPFGLPANARVDQQLPHRTLDRAQEPGATSTSTTIAPDTPTMVSSKAGVTVVAVWDCCPRTDRSAWNVVEVSHWRSTLHGTARCARAYSVG